MTKRKTFSKEFKLEAVRLLELAERSPTEIATDLGVRRNQLYKWQEPTGSDSIEIDKEPISNSHLLFNENDRNLLQISDK